MATTTPTFPTYTEVVDTWKKWATQTEQQWNEHCNQLMGTETFANSMGKYLSEYIAMQKQIAEYAEKYVQAMNIPTRNDFTTLADRMSAIETQVATLTDAIKKTPAKAG